MDEGEQQSVQRRPASATTTGTSARRRVSCWAGRQRPCQQPRPLLQCGRGPLQPRLGWRIPPRTPGGPLG